MTVTTKAGKVFECDFAVESPSFPVLYLNITGSTVKKVSAAFMNAAKELPLVEYPAYTEFHSLSVEPGGIKVTLRKEA